MKKLIHLLIAAAVTVAALSAVLAALLLNRPDTGEERYVFSQRQPTDIVSLELENSRGVISVALEDEGYTIDGVPSEIVDIDGFIEFMVACSGIEARRQVAEAAADPADYGLEEPQARLTVRYSDGGVLKLRLGGQEPLSKGWYAACDGRDGVYLLPDETAEHYLIAREQLISFLVTPKLTASSALSALGDVTFTGGPLEEPVTVESVSAGGDDVRQLARSFGAATHIVRGAGVYELDQSYALEVISPLCGLTGQAILRYGLTAAEEDALGFADPWYQIEFDYKTDGETAERYCLRFLPAGDDGTQFFVNAKGNGLVYMVDREAFFDLAYEKLLLRWFLSPLLMDVEGITLRDGNTVYEFAIDQTDAKNPVAAVNGEPLDISLFRDFFRLLGSAAHDGTYRGAQPDPEGEAAMVITYHYTQGKADDVMALYPGDTRRVDVYVNGVCEFAMKDTFVERVRQALPALLAGEGFDTNW